MIRVAGEMRNGYRTFIAKTEGKKPRRRWTIMKHKEIVYMRLRRETSSGLF
jgi:hypothetical protein